MIKAISDQEAEELMRRTEVIEDEKAARQADRLEKKRQKERQAQQTFLEKLVAPGLLILTILISLVLFLTR